MLSPSPVNESKVRRVVCWIKLQYCPISLGKSLWVCMCTERKEKYMALHFRADCVLPGVAAPLARQLGGKPEHTFSPLLLLLLVNQPDKPDNNQERFMELITKIQS